MHNQTVRRYRLLITAVMLIILAGGGLLLAWFLHRQGLARADQWSSVIGMFLNILAVILALLGVWLGWKGLHKPPVGDDSSVDSDSAETVSGSVRTCGGSQPGSVAQENSGGINIAINGNFEGDIGIDRMQ